MEVVRGDKEMAGAQARLQASPPSQPFSLLSFLTSLSPQLRHHLWETGSQVPVWSCALGVPAASPVGAPPGPGSPEGRGLKCLCSRL